MVWNKQLRWLIEFCAKGIMGVWCLQLAGKLCKGTQLVITGLAEIKNMDSEFIIKLVIY